MDAGREIILRFKQIQVLAAQVLASSGKQWQFQNETCEYAIILKHQTSVNRMGIKRQQTSVNVEF